MKVQSDAIPQMIPDSILETRKLYEDCGFKFSNFSLEVESTDYHACRFEVNDKKVIFRKAKITPTKVGQFVTLWKRIEGGPIQPFESSDTVDLFIIIVQSGSLLGQFVFPKSLLVEQGIVSNESKEGKRAIRVYPPWDVAKSKQAQRTQKWQLEYFLSMDKNKPVNFASVKKFYT